MVIVQRSAVPTRCALGGEDEDENDGVAENAITRCSFAKCSLAHAFNYDAGAGRAKHERFHAGH